MTAHSAVQRLNICLGVGHAHDVIHDHHDPNHHSHGAHPEQEHTDHYHHADHTHMHQPGFHTHHFHPELRQLDQKSIAIVEQITGKFLGAFKSLSEEFIKNSSQTSSRVSAILTLIHESTISREETLHFLASKHISEIQPKLWAILSSIECRNELIEAKAFLGRESLSLADVLSYQYCGDYEPLVNRELDCLFASFPTLDRKRAADLEFVFIGAGPMPLSAIYIHCILGSRVICVDIDSNAAAAGADLLKRIGLEEKLPYLCTKTQRIKFHSQQIIFIASLVQGKLNVVQTLPKEVKFSFFTFFHRL